MEKSGLEMIETTYGTGKVANYAGITFSIMHVIIISCKNTFGTKSTPRPNNLSRIIASYLYYLQGKTDFSD